MTSRAVYKVARRATPLGSFVPLVAGLALTVSALACGDGSGEETETGVSITSFTSNPSAGTTPSASGASLSTSDGTMTATATQGTAGTTSGSDASMSMSNSDASNSGTNPDGLPNGADCDNDGQCASGFCYTIPIVWESGLCSQCKTDQHCMDSGAGISCSPDVVNKYAACSDGSIGDYCMTQAACKEGLICAELIAGLGVILPNSCSQCATTADCDGNTLCTPTLNADELSGHRLCVTPGSVANDSPCPEDGTGDAVCASGHCNVMTIDEFPALQVGLCGECSNDADCGEGTCMEGVLDLQEPKGSTCV